MIKNIIKDINFLKIKSTDMTKDDLHIVDDLIDTLKFHQDKCIGMAANMIGYSKNAIIVGLKNRLPLVMINPKILEKSDMYFTEEGCLSLSGERKTIRFNKIKVEYYDKNFKKYVKSFEGLEAQVIQHEIDHLFGIII